MGNTTTTPQAVEAADLEFLELQASSLFNDAYLGNCFHKVPKIEIGMQVLQNVEDGNATVQDIHTNQLRIFSNIHFTSVHAIKVSTSF